jgi:DnaJ-class molecular chaperone
VAIKEVPILKKISNNVFLIQCNFCEGTGTYSSKIDTSGEEWKITEWIPQDTCLICHGKGLIQVESPDVLIYDGVCRGTGHQGSGSVHLANYSCPACRGLGVRSLTGETSWLKLVSIIKTFGPNTYLIPCVYCWETGRRPLFLKEGTAYIVGIEAEWQVADWHNEACPICDGKAALKIESPDVVLVDMFCEGTGHNVSIQQGEEQKTEEWYEAIADSVCPKCKGLGVRSATGEIKLLT